MLVWIIGIIIYGLTGLIINGVINEGHQDSSILVILCWPLIIKMISFFYILESCTKLGKFIKKIMKGRR